MFFAACHLVSVIDRRHRATWVVRVSAYCLLSLCQSLCACVCMFVMDRFIHDDSEFSHIPAGRGGIRGGSTLGQGEHFPHLRFTCCPQIQKLADHSDVISEVPKCSKVQTFWGSAPDPAGGAYNAPPEPLADGKGARYPCQEPTPAVGPSGLVSTHLRVTDEFATLLMIDFKCRPI